MTKFKVGDKVKIREGLQSDGEYGGYSCTGVMASMAGKVPTVKSVEYDFYSLESSIFCWTDEMLEPAKLTEIELSFTELIEKLPELEVGTKFEVVNEPDCVPVVVNLTDKDSKRLEWQFPEGNIPVTITDITANYRFKQVQTKPEYIAIKWQEALQIIADGGTAYADDKKIAVNSGTYFENLIIHSNTYVANNLGELLCYTDWYKKAE